MNLLIVYNPSWITEEAVLRICELLPSSAACITSIPLSTKSPNAPDIRIWNLATANSGDIPPEVIDLIKKEGVKI